MFSEGLEKFELFQVVSDMSGAHDFRVPRTISVTRVISDV